MDIEKKWFKLMDFPLEILEQIFDYHRDNKPLLCALTTQCRSLHQVVRRIFFKKVELSLIKLDHSFFFNRPAQWRTLLLENVVFCPGGLSSTLDHDDVSVETLGLFTRSLREDSELRFMVRTLQLEWKFGCQETHDYANALIDKFPNLRSLKITERITTWRLDQRPSFCFPKGEMMGRLDEVTLSQGVYDSKSFRYMKQVKIFTLEDTTIPTALQLNVPEKSKHLVGTSPVAELNLGSAFLTLTEHSLRNVLKWPKSLQKLRLAPPGTDGWVRIEGLTKRKFMTSPLSPKALEKALASQRHSLVELHVFNHNIEWEGQHDLSCLDLRCFQTLRKIVIPSLCLFPPTADVIKTRGLYQLLPHSLVQLRVVFDFGEYIEPGLEADGRTRTVLTLEHSKWIMALAEKKFSCFPLLEKVSLVECCGYLEWGYHPPTDCSLPPIMAEAFSKAGIELFVMVRRFPPQITA